MMASKAPYGLLLLEKMAKKSAYLKYNCTFVPCNMTTKTTKTMKIRKNAEDEKDPLWVIIVKIVIYALGLFLAGYGTTASAMTLGLI